MYKIGEFVVYGNDGVCEVEDISKLDIQGINEKKNYYILKPMHENGKIFAPTDTSVFMRPVATHEEIDKIIREIPLIEESEYDTKNMRLLQEYYKELFKNHNCIDLLTIVVNLSDKKADLEKKGKKLGQVEEKYLKSAKNLLENEFSVVLGIPKEEIEDYIKDKMKQ